MNDLGGCRAIMADIAGVRNLIASMREKFPHELHQKEFNYIDAPKPDGYRSHHMVYLFQPRNEDQEPFKGRRVELQVRTRLQHSWATAVEAVGLYRGEDLKHSNGSGDWLRLFQLMSQEFAEVEGCEGGQNVVPRNERISELKNLNGHLGAVATLENIKNVTHYSKDYIQTGERSRY